MVMIQNSADKSEMIFKVFCSNLLTRWKMFFGDVALGFYAECFFMRVL